MREPRRRRFRKILANPTILYNLSGFRGQASLSSRKIDLQHFSIAVSDFGVRVAAAAKTRPIGMRNVNSPNAVTLKKRIIVVMLGGCPWEARLDSASSNSDSFLLRHLWFRLNVAANKSDQAKNDQARSHALISRTAAAAKSATRAAHAKAEKRFEPFS
jgi:hypothetical protein